MKTILQCFIIAIGWFSVWYSITAFGMWEIHPGKWDAFYRLMSALPAFICSLVFISMHVVTTNDRKKSNRDSD